MQELFKDKEYCYSQIREARKLSQNINTTIDQFDNISSTLAFMYIYCPDDLQDIVLDTMDEIEKRKISVGFKALLS